MLNIRRLCLFSLVFLLLFGCDASDLPAMYEIKNDEDTYIVVDNQKYIWTVDDFWMVKTTDSIGMLNLEVGLEKPLVMDLYRTEKGSVLTASVAGILENSFLKEGLSLPEFTFENITMYEVQTGDWYNKSTTKTKASGQELLYYFEMFNSNESDSLADKYDVIEADVYYDLILHSNGDDDYHHISQILYYETDDVYVLWDMTLCYEHGVSGGKVHGKVLDSRIKEVLF